MAASFGPWLCRHSPQESFKPRPMRSQVFAYFTILNERVAETVQAVTQFHQDSKTAALICAPCVTARERISDER
jgi:hypothetical protein